MRADTSRHALEPFVLDTSNTVTVMLAIRSAQDDIVHRRLGLHDAVADDFRELCAAEARRLANKDELIPYEPGYKPDRHQLLFLDVQSEPALQDRLNSIAPGQVDLIEGDDTSLNDTLYYGIVFESNSQERATFFRHTTTMFEPQRKKMFLLFEDGQYNRTREPHLLFDRTIDCAAFNEVLFVDSPSQFERMFGYLDGIRARASAVLDDFIGAVPVSNEDEFRAATTGQIQMLRKLSKITGRPYVTTLSMEKVRSIIEMFKLEIEINVDGKLVFDQDPRRRWLILKLLDDDFLSSAMTNLRYEANSKISL